MTVGDPVAGYVASTRPRVGDGPFWHLDAAARVIGPACTPIAADQAVDQLAASPATVPGTPLDSPAGVRWPSWPTAQPTNFCASASIAYR
jgi:hypothetical protein